MISSIFGKTKPINYIIVLTFLFLFYWLNHIFVFKSFYSPERYIKQTLILAVLLFSIFVINFIVKRNKLTESNSFTILFYALLIIVFPEVLMDNNAILCSFFLLLSTRKLLSLKSLKNSKSKIFDASLWIATASLFYDWALLYLILVFVAINIYEPKHIKNWLVPFVALFSVLIILICVLILKDNIAFLEEHYTFNVSLTSGYFLELQNSTKFMGYVLITILLSLFAFLKIGKTGLGRVSTIKLIAVSYVIGVVLTLLKTTNTIFPVMVTFFPAVIFLTNYVEAIKKPNIKEILLISMVLIPFIIFTINII